MRERERQREERPASVNYADRASDVCVGAFLLFIVHLCQQAAQLSPGLWHLTVSNVGAFFRRATEKKVNCSEHTRARPGIHAESGKKRQTEKRARGDGETCLC